MPEEHIIENELLSRQASQLLRDVRSEAVSACHLPLRSLKLLMRICKYFFGLFTIMTLVTLVYHLFRITLMLYNDPGIILRKISDFVVWTFGLVFGSLYNVVVKEEVIIVPWHVEWRNYLHGCWLVGMDWLKINWKICIIVCIFFTIFLYILIKIKRGFYSFCRRMRRVQHGAYVHAKVRNEAMVAGSEFSKRENIPAYQIGIEMPGAIFDTHIGWGIRVRNYLVTYFHITRDLRTVILHSSSGLKYELDLSLYKRRRSKVNTDLVYYKLDNSIFAALAATSALCPEKIFAMNHYVESIGMWGLGSRGELSRYNPSLGLVAYGGSTKAGFSGSAYYRPASPRMCYGLHNGAIGSGGPNFGTSQVVIENEVRMFEILDDPSMKAKYLKMVELKRLANANVKNTPESARKAGQYGRTGFRILSTNANGQHTYDNSDYDRRYDETDRQRTRDRHGASYDEYDVEMHVREQWESDDYDDQQFDEDYSTELTMSWADYRNQFDSAIRAFAPLVDQPAAILPAPATCEANRPTITITANNNRDIQVPFSEVVINPHVGGGLPETAVRVASAPVTMSLHESYLLLEGRVRSLEHRLDQVNTLFKKLNVRQCGLCSYAAPHSIAKHLREAHGDVSLGLLKTCSHCNHKFDSEAFLAHKCYTCELCGKKCTQSGIEDHKGLCNRRAQPKPVVDGPSTSAQAVKTYAKVAAESAIATDFVEQVATNSVPFLEQPKSSKKRTKRRSKKPSSRKVSEPNSSSTEVLLSKMLESQMTSHKLLEKLVQKLDGPSAGVKLN